MKRIGSAPGLVTVFTILAATFVASTDDAAAKGINSPRDAASGQASGHRGSRTPPQHPAKWVMTQAECDQNKGAYTWRAEAMRGCPGTFACYARKTANAHDDSFLGCIWGK